MSEWRRLTPRQRRVRAGPVTVYQSPGLVVTLAEDAPDLGAWSAVASTDLPSDSTLPPLIRLVFSHGSLRAPQRPPPLDRPEGSR
jgi:hypothetical protein